MSYLMKFTTSNSALAQFPGMRRLSMILTDQVTFGVLLTSSEKVTIFPPVFLMKANNDRTLG